MIIDASVAVPWLIETPFSFSARQIKPRRPIAPNLLVVETCNVLLKHVRMFNLPVARVYRSLDNLGVIFAEFADDRKLLPHAIEIAGLHRHRIYDCLYLALAIERREPLATADRRLAALAQKLNIETQLIEPAL